MVPSCGDEQYRCTRELHASDCLFCHYLYRRRIEKRLHSLVVSWRQVAVCELVVRRHLRYSLYAAICLGSAVQSEALKFDRLFLSCFETSKHPKLLELCIRPDWYRPKKGRYLTSIREPTYCTMPGQLDKPPLF